MSPQALEEGDAAIAAEEQAIANECARLDREDVSGERAAAKEQARLSLAFRGEEHRRHRDEAIAKAAQEAEKDAVKRALEAAAHDDVKAYKAAEAEAAREELRKVAADAKRAKVCEALTLFKFGTAYPHTSERKSSYLYL